MKTYLLPIALASLAISAMAGAQSPPPSSSSSATAPSSSSAQSPSSSSYSSSDSKAQMKDCVAKQKATNPSISDADAKTACSKSKDQ